MWAKCSLWIGRTTSGTWSVRRKMGNSSFGMRSRPTRRCVDSFEDLPFDRVCFSSSARYYDADNVGSGLCLFTIGNDGCLRVRKGWKVTGGCVCFFRGLDNKVTLYPLNAEDDASKQKKVVATHANYVSSCKFMHSDQQVILSSIVVSRAFIRASALCRCLASHCEW